MMNRLLVYCNVGMLLMLAACSPPLKDWDPSDYTVQSGDTLYSIAWRYEIDPADLAKWNRIDSPSLIYPGQRLHTRKPENFDAAPPPLAEDPEAELVTEVVEVKPTPKPAPARSAERRVVVKKNDTLYRIARNNGVSVAQLIEANRLKKPYRIYAGQKLRLTPPRHSDSRKPSQSTVVTAKDKPRHTTSKATSRKTRLTWRWPVKGKVIKRFNKRRLDSRGIDIRVAKPRPVKAAANGKVVYSGNGLIGYGNLVIIKHNNTYLSAYANNHKLLVREGETVKQGQVIAELGKTGSQKPVLHFEIRKRGKPVDPLRYLPSS